jgi:NitT/TauT family transport system ATP-binding protein
LIDLVVFFVVIAAISFIVLAASRWSAPLTPAVKIDLSPGVLPLYAGYSLLRMLLGYILSLIFTLVYGQIAATHRRAEAVMIPVLDILQSIPILSFLPAVILALVAAFPHSNVGLELSSVILIFTSQAWNMTFSFYHSERTLPKDLQEVATISRLRPWQRFIKLESSHLEAALWSCGAAVYTGIRGSTMTQSDQHIISDSATSAETLVEARICSKTYEAEGKLPKGVTPHLVLDSVQLSIHAGEFVALLGPSGSGKSTLLRILAGLIQPSQGHVYFKDQPQHGPNPHVAIVFQSFALFPWLTVLQNVEIGLESQPLTPTQRLKKALAAIDMIGLDGFEDAYPKELSGGMRQRVGFARALVVEPELLFMDEPFSALDVLTATNLRKELLGLWREQSMPTRAILLVTHNIDEAVSMADRILVLGANPGRIRVELPGLPVAQRSFQSEEHTKLVDLIYSIMTSPQEDVGKLLAIQSPYAKTGQLVPTAQRPYQVLPHVSIGDVTGLIELVHARGGREDLYQIGRHLQLEIDDLFPLLEATDLLSLADTVEGDLVLTEEGKRFAEASVLQEKQIFRDQVMKHVSLVRKIVEALQEAPRHVLPEEHFLQFLETYFGKEEAQAQLETAINWGRYAELYSFQEDRGMFRLEEEGEPASK